MKLEKRRKLKVILILNAVVILAIISTLFIILSKSTNERVVAIELPAPPELLDRDRVFSSPQTIFIPSIGVSSSVENVGITEEGNMDVPKDFDNVGWFRHGPEPGSTGNAVIAGHLDTGSGKPAVFFDLKNIKVGDEVIVLNEEGERLRFIVRKIEFVDYANPPKETLNEIFGESDLPRLNLITCDGTWLPEKKTYTDRLIVFTDFVGVINQP